ncbi:MlaD family protein [Chitinophagaceae bacterium MMS25-I14]
MAKRAANNMVLGVFVIAGLAVLVFALYMIGKNQSFFSSSLTIKATFRNVNGLMPGNNVRFAGIQCGTVKNIRIINDTTLEVTMLINSKTGNHIRKSAFVNIGNEGLMGNKVVNIEPGSEAASGIEDGDMLQSSHAKGLNDMLGTLSSTNDNAADISEQLKEVAIKLNNSQALWLTLNDSTLPENLHQSLANIRSASAAVNHAAQAADLLMQHINNGKGAAGVLLSDNEAAANLSGAISHIHTASIEADKLVTHLDSLVQEIHAETGNGKGTIHALLKDTAMTNRLNRSLGNIEAGTAAFSADMEALKHNFLLKGYFRKQERNSKK